MKSTVFLAEARLEMEEAAQFYDAQEPGLGAQFLDAIQRAVDDVSVHPRRWPVIGRNVRRRLVGRFPYGILYRVGRLEVVVVAVMHLHRHPHYWTKRIDKRR
jgi:plasmid stabilization system protein ParE